MIKRILRIALLLCVAAGAAVAGECLPANVDGVAAEGALTTRDGAFILKMPEAICLKGADEFDNVEATKEIHVFSFEDKVQAALASLVGKNVRVRGNMMGAITQHHKAPIVMQVTEASAI